MKYITGDTHGHQSSLDRFNSTNFPISHYMTKKDFLIIAGDFGWVWQQKQSKDELWGLEWLSKKPWTTLFIDGNHENFDRLYTYPLVSMFGGKVRQVHDTVYHLQRAQVYTIDNSTILTFGGGLSIDKHLRREGTSWWPQEYPTEQERNDLWYHVQNGKPVDYIITHVAPSSIIGKDIYADKILDVTSVLLDDIHQSGYRCKTWYFGHYHIDQEFTSRGQHFRALYQDVIRID